MPQSRTPHPEKTLVLLKLLPSSKPAGDAGRPKGLPRIEAAGIRDHPVDPYALDDAECEERMRQVLQLIAEVEQATQHAGMPDQRVDLADWLVRSSYTLRQIRSAAESVAVMETYGRPLAREFWFKAFAQPLVHPGRIRELCRQAYEKGRKEEKERAAKEAGPPGIDPLTRRLLDVEKELMRLRAECEQLKARNNRLERENRALLRRWSNAAETTFYRIGDRLVVEHFRENGQVYYHEQDRDETGIPWDRCRRLPEAEFDRQLAARNPVILTETEIVRLPGYRHWLTGE